MKRERERDGISLGTSNKLPEQFKYVGTEVGLFHGRDVSHFFSILRKACQVSSSVELTTFI